MGNSMRILIAVSLGASMPAVALAGPLEDGIAAYHQGDYAKALRLFRIAAAKGDAEAQFNVGKMYQDARGVNRNYAEALHWYRLAVAQNNSDAQYRLGFMYESGSGVTVDKIEALRLYRLSAAQGNDDGINAVRRLTDPNW